MLPRSSFGLQLVHAGLRCALIVSLAATPLVASSCGDPDRLATCEEAGDDATCALFDVSGQTPDLFALPYPNDILLKADGTIDLRQLDQGRDDAVALFTDVVARNAIQGFGLSTAAYVRFSGPIDESCLPKGPAESLATDAAVQWINVDAASPDFGKRIPAEMKYEADAGNYIGAHHLAIMPMSGFPLLPATRYAVVLTDALCAADGRAVHPTESLAALLEPNPPLDPALAAPHQRYAPLREYLRGGDLEGAVISAAVFTTGKPTDLLSRARKAVHSQPAPQLRDPRIYWETSSYYELLANYEAPNLQFGTPPYTFQGDGGGFKLGPGGTPAIAFQEQLRVSITVPKGPQPPGGWPVVIYAHGTGGDYRSYARSGMSRLFARITDRQGQVLARVASVGIDQTLHGTRTWGLAKVLAYLNVLNPEGAVGSRLQAAVDDFSLLRLLKGVKLDKVSWARGAGKTTPVSFSPPVRFDPQHMLFMGHSQGAITGALFVPFEPDIRGAVFSAGGGGIVDNVVNTSQDARPLLEAVLLEPVTMFHPIIAMVQHVFEPIDPYHYGRLTTSHRPAGVDPKHLLFIEGVEDHNVPNNCTEGHALTAGAQLAGPQLTDAPALALAGMSPLPLPVQGNLKLPEGAFTAVLLQYSSVPLDPAVSCEVDDDCGSGDYCAAGACHHDGHFVSFTNPRTQRHLGQFVADVARSMVPTIGQ